MGNDVGATAEGGHAMIRDGQRKHGSDGSENGYRELRAFVCLCVCDHRKLRCIKLRHVYAFNAGALTGMTWNCA